MVGFNTEESSARTSKTLNQHFVGINQTFTKAGKVIQWTLWWQLDTHFKFPKSMKANVLIPIGLNFLVSTLKKGPIRLRPPPYLQEYDTQNAYKLSSWHFLDGKKHWEMHFPLNYLCVLNWEFHRKSSILYKYLRTIKVPHRKECMCDTINFFLPKSPSK